jgi:anti-anti-sigma regulatory factor
MEGQEGEPRRLQALEGDWTVARAAELHGLAQEWAAESTVLSLDCSRLGRIDLSFLQVILALKRALAAKGGALLLISPAGTLEAALAATGLAEELLA